MIHFPRGEIIFLFLFFVLFFRELSVADTVLLVTEIPAEKTIFAIFTIKEESAIFAPFGVDRELDLVAVETIDEIDTTFTLERKYTELAVLEMENTIAIFVVFTLK
jgi:hypothetical protein